VADAVEAVGAGVAVEADLVLGLERGAFESDAESQKRRRFFSSSRSPVAEERATFFFLRGAVSTFFSVSPSRP
jgi:hypothetical protein